MCKKLKLVAQMLFSRENRFPYRGAHYFCFFQRLNIEKSIEFQKRMRVKRLPTILALHLKRFKYMEQYNRHIKVSHRVVFPLELRLFNTVRKIVESCTSFSDGLSRFKYLVLHISLCHFRDSPTIDQHW